MSILSTILSLSTILPNSAEYPAISAIFLPLADKKQASATLTAFSPDILITPIEPSPTGVAIAAIVSLIKAPSFK